MNEKILDKIKSRLEIGAKKYGEELNIEDGREWIQESIEEILDTCVYLAAKLLQIQEVESKLPLKVSEEEVKFIHEALEDTATNLYIETGISDKYGKLKGLIKRIEEAGKL